MAYSLISQQLGLPVTRSAPPWKFEIILAAALLAVGLALVPAAVYWAGSAVVGDYAGDGGALGLIGKIWADAGRGRLTAWALFLAPYLIVQLLRLSWACLRARPAVTDLTNT